MTREGDCIHMIWERFHRRQCTRKAVVRGAYCKQHDPEAIEARRRAQEAEWKTEREARAAVREREEAYRLAVNRLIDGCRNRYEDMPFGVKALIDAVNANAESKP